MKTKDIITSILFAAWCIISLIYKLWWPNKIFDYGGIVCGVAIWWLCSFGFKSEYKWLVVLNYVWLTFINILFIWYTYDLIIEMQ